MPGQGRPRLHNVTARLLQETLLIAQTCLNCQLATVFCVDASDAVTRIFGLVARVPVLKTSTHTHT